MYFQEDLENTPFNLRSPDCYWVRSYLITTVILTQKRDENPLQNNIPTISHSASAEGQAYWVL